MSRVRTIVPVLAGLTLVWGAPVHGSAPGNISEVARAGLLHVCVDSEPGDTDYIVCKAQEPFASGDILPGNPYTGEECEQANLPPVCVIDFVPRPKLRARMSLSYDDDARDGGGTQTGLSLEFLLRGRHLLVELFDTTKLGNWNPIPSEANVFDEIEFSSLGFGSTSFQFANGNLADLGLELTAIADAAVRKFDLSETVPVVTRIEQARNALESDHSEPGDPLASQSSWKVALEFARVRP